ncbi:chromate transporter [Stenotrophomonas maltophilia]|uniref:chromate transporter n=1 Tax=Stenotrophomonas maltophilia TaxID=40324 RepID=UPI003D187C0F
MGLTSFGGPIAHLSYFRLEFVERRRWLTDRSYSDLVALCQLLPGPAKQPGWGVAGLGPRRLAWPAGRLGRLIAWVRSRWRCTSSATRAAMRLECSMMTRICERGEIGQRRIPARKRILPDRRAAVGQKWILQSLLPEPTLQRQGGAPAVRPLSHQLRLAEIFDRLPGRALRAPASCSI